MKKISLALLVLLFFSSAMLGTTPPCKPRRHGKLPVVKDYTYHKARTRLLAAGWQPLQTRSSSDADVSSGNGPLFWRKGYVEIEACSGTGVARCAFLFRDAYGNRLRVTTAGEELPSEKYYARVSSLRFVCD